MGGGRRGQKGWINDELSHVVAGGPQMKQQVMGLKQKKGYFTHCSLSM